MFWTFFFIFGVCEFGQQLSGKFEEINVVYDQFTWYSFPFNVQKMLPMIMLNAQQWVGFECFGTIPCDRETFKKASTPNFEMILRFLK